MKAVDQFFPVAGTVYYAVQGGSKTFKSVDDKCGHANAVYFTLKGCPCGQNSIKKKKNIECLLKTFSCWGLTYFVDKGK